MKIFVFAVIMLLTVTLILIFNQYYVENAVNTVDDLIKDLPDRLSDGKKTSEQMRRRLDDTIEFWQSIRFKLCLMINRSDFEEIESLLLELRASSEVNDHGLYGTSLFLLKEKLSRLKKAESLSIEGIL